MHPVDAPAGAPRPDSLALLYQGVFTGIVRIQAERQTLGDSETFRRRMKVTLREVEREASRTGYAPAEIRAAEFAVVALLDETILSSKDPKADEWRKRPLNPELFGQAIAGNVFFDKLAEIERGRDSWDLADVLEVYLLCLLLGFEGRFAPPLRGEAYNIMERLRGRIEAIRGIDYKLSPPMDLRLEPTLTAAGTPAWRWWVVGTLASLGLLFLLYRLHLSWTVGHLASRLTDLATSVRVA